MIQAAIQESFAEIRPWLPWADKIPTPEESEARVRKNVASWVLREDLPLYIMSADGSEFIGGSGLHRMNWAVPKFEIGYWIRTSRLGQGFITETVAALTQYAFRALKARRVEIRCDPDNERSAAIPKKLGFDLEGRLRFDSVTPHSGRPRDTLVYARITENGLPDVSASW